MKTFKVTYLYQGKINTQLVYGHHSIPGVKKFITDSWNKELIFDSKIIHVEKIDLDKE